MLTEKKIGVLMGGTSAEREVSLKSGDAIFRALKNLGYNVSAVDVGTDICEMLKKEKIEIAFLALHGGVGEDGSIQGLLEVMGIPYTGSGVLASALAMDKLASKKVFSYHGIPVPRFEVVTKTQASLKGSVTFPVVVKPSREGSSIGVSVVKEKEELDEALKTAFSFDDTAIVEEYIEGREIHIGVLGRKVLGGVEVRPRRGFYDYTAKYSTEAGTEYILPPELDEHTYEKAKTTALNAHLALGCSGATRVDLRVDNKGNPYVLEVNTIPGMTETSLLPKIAKQTGLDFPSLIEEILKDALSRMEANAGEK
jgi:D-alanine-D-alanine ligase